ncbi:MAG TPA: esterase-like activity of phytase family protein [Stellaceae bacterium]
MLLALVMAAVACAATSRDLPPGSADAAVHATVLPLAPGVPAGHAAGTGDALVFRGALKLTAEDPRFGGLSGLAVDPAGRALSVSDNGHFVAFDLVEEGQGDLVGVANGWIETMRAPDGHLLRRTRERDAEELVLLPDGTRLVVFERNVRLGWFPPDSARASRMAPLPGLVPPTNTAIEAMVRFADGRLLLIAEGQGEERGGIRDAWIGTPGHWEPLAYVPEHGFDVSGAALLPDGDLLVLERAASVFQGFRNRLTRVPGRAIRPGARLQGKELLRLVPPYLTDNFEGVAARREADGRTAVYLVSDDNYMPFQRTLLLKFDLAE